MLLHSLDLTTALRPSLLPDESLLFVRDGIGLYQGDRKIPDLQDGHVYLTSYRVCYVDNESPRSKAVAVHLKDVERCEIYAGFLKSSPKVTVHPKAAKQFGLPQRLQIESSSKTLTSRSNATWVCPICSFSNPVPANFDPATSNEATPLPTCMTCGLKPPLMVVVKAALAAVSSQTSAHTSGQHLQCPRCTFENHPSMASCEICGATLPRIDSPASASPAPVPTGDPMESFKLSFRSGGEKMFLERIKSALVQRKWLLQSAPSTSTENQSRGGTPPPSRNIGITGLERRDREMRKNNEVVIGNAFEDLSALMASAKEIIALAETFAKQAKGSEHEAVLETTRLLSSLNLTTTRDMLGSSTSATSNATYIEQLARQVADFLTDDTSGTAVLKASGGIISLVDLWAIVNRARGGVELVSPHDFADAVDTFNKLRLPVRVRTFASGLRVVCGAEWSEERISTLLLGWLESLRRQCQTQANEINWGKGVTPAEVAERFGWSIGVAAEELTAAEVRGEMCRDSDIGGIRFWPNWFTREVSMEQ